MLRTLLLLLLCCSAHATQDKPLRLNFGVYPSDRATVMYRKFSPILDAIRVPLETQLKQEVDIHLTIFEDYESGIKALANGEIDFVRFGPSSYILAEQLNPDIQLLAMELRKGLKRFNGLIIAHKDANIKDIVDLEGKTFAFGNKNSTVGRFLAQALMADQGVTAESFSSFDFLGRHDLVAKAVITRTHDAGALKDSTYKKLCDPEEIIVVRAFANVTKPWIARSGLSKEICDAITASLLLLQDNTVIGELGCSGFSKATQKDYDLVREGMKNSEAFDPKTEDEVNESD